MKPAILKKDEKYFNFSNSNFLMLTTKASYSKNIINILSDLKLNENKLAKINQIHSDNIVYAEEEGHYGNADGVISNIQFNITLSIVTADCIPIFITDSYSGFFGLIHAGWRGVVKRIHIKSIKEFIKKGALLKDINIFLGPFIHSCCYEIKNDIICNFSKQYIHNKENKIYLDLSSIIIDDFIKMGIEKKHISKSNICTFENLNCYSYRRDRKKSGRMHSIISYKR